MIPWVQVFSNLPQHDKVVCFAETLGLKCSGVSPEAAATGMLVSLWCWAVQNRTDGDLSGVNPRTIAKACQWEKTPDKLVAALKSCGWIDEDMRIHDWEEYSVRLMENQEVQKEKTRKRVAEYRERKRYENSSKDVTCATCNDDVTVTCSAGVTVTCNDGNENVTIPPSSPSSPLPPSPHTPYSSTPYYPPTSPLNQTIPDHTKPDREEVVVHKATWEAGNGYAAAETDILTDLDTVRQAWNALGLNQIGPIDPMTGRGAALQNRLEKYGTDFVLKAVQAVENSAFLRGDNDKGWKASLDWILQEDHLVKAAEGGYEDFKASPTKAEDYEARRAVTKDGFDENRKAFERIMGRSFENAE